MLKSNNVKNSIIFFCGVLLSGVFLGASADHLQPISADYKLQDKVKNVLLADPDIVDATVHVNSNGKVYIDFQDNYISPNYPNYTCQEEKVEREREIWSLVAETAGVDERDVFHFQQGDSENNVKAVIENWEQELDNIIEIQPYHQYHLSPQDFEYLNNRIAQGELAAPNFSPDEAYFWEVWYEVERHSVGSGVSNAQIGSLTWEQKANVLMAFDELGSGFISDFWYYDENGEARCETSFDHLYSDGTVVSNDFGETWDITEEKTLYDIDQGR